MCFNLYNNLQVGAVYYLYCTDEETGAESKVQSLAKGHKAGRGWLQTQAWSFQDTPTRLLPADKGNVILYGETNISYHFQGMWYFA